jgi:hypothetical protein
MTAAVATTRQQQQTALARVQADPAAFRSVLNIDTDDGPKRLSVVMDDWQARDFAAIDPALRRVVGQDVQPKHQRVWLERPRGHSKTGDLSTHAAYVTFASPFKIDGAIYAGDKDQAALHRNAIVKTLQYNPWLNEHLECNKFEIVNKITGSKFTIESADVASSFGQNLQMIIADETTHWPKRDLWDSIISTAAKRKNCLLVSIANAGYQDHWTWELREAIRNDPAWYFSRLDGPVASWLSPSVLAEQRRLLPPQVFDRLWLNNWQECDNSAIDQNDVQACCMLRGPQPRRIDRLALATLDIGVKKDFTGLAILHIDLENHRVEFANGWQWRPQDHGGRIDMDIIRQAILKARDEYKFGSIVADTWQGYLLLDDLEREGIAGIPWNFTPQNRDLMARTLIESLQARTFRFWNHPGLLRDLSKLRVAEAPHLGLRLEAPRDPVGGHCDLGMCVAQALPLAMEIALHGLPNYGGGGDVYGDSDHAEVLRPV